MVGTLFTLGARWKLFKLIFHGLIAADQKSSYPMSAIKAESRSEGLGLSDLGSLSAPALAAPKSAQEYQTPRRAQNYGREPEELHIQTSNMNSNQQTSRDRPRHHSYHSSHEFAGGSAPGINVHQATPQGHQHSSASGDSSLPGALQSGRPGPPLINTSSAMPNLPQTPSHPQKHTDYSRSSSSTQVHGYSRSSPAGLEQKYAPFVNTLEASKYASTPIHKYISSQTPKGETSYSPLGLADIRPHIEAALSDGSLSANPYSNEVSPFVSTNCNYLAPWAVYAFDWCKWPVQKYSSSDGAGKMAIGSYVEDGHNFVSL